jgi:uncharacterized membrane protein
MSTQSSANVGSTGLVIPVAFLAIGILLVVIAEFFLDGLADENTTWHWIQHGVFFLGGVGVGIGGARLWTSGQK